MKTRFRSVSVAGAMAGLIVASVAGIPPAFAGAPTCWGRSATIVGTTGEDRLVGSRGPDVIVGLGGDDFILGKGGDDRACGGPGNDYLAGGRGDDRLETGPGNNAVSGDEGNDVLQGGPGPDDNANYLDAPGPVHANIAQGVATGQGRDILMAGIDELFGSRFDDVLIGDGRGQLLVGLGGDDTLRSGGGWDLLAGGAGDDLIDGGGGVGDWLDDLEFGGRIGRKPVHLDLAEGVETGHGTDTLLRIEGTLGSPADDVLIGDDGPNGLIGGDGDDVIDGAGGDDVVEGDAGMDEVDGGPGTDYFSSYGSPTAVTINLVTGTSMGADPSTDSDTLSNIEDVQGSPFDDTIIGNDGPNALRGDPGADTISGGDGDDILIGDCAGAPPHFYIEDAFDCSSPDHPDGLDGGAGTDLCIEGETVTACESTTASEVRPAEPSG